MRNTSHVAQSETMTSELATLRVILRSQSDPTPRSAQNPKSR
jgi:hypothetical protein